MGTTYLRSLNKRKRIHFCSIVMIMMICAICSLVRINGANAELIKVNKNAFIRAVAQSPLMDTLNNVFGADSAIAAQDATKGTAYVGKNEANVSGSAKSAAWTTGPDKTSINKGNIAYRIQHEPPVSTVEDALKGIGAGIILIIMYIKIIQEMERGDPSMNFWFRVFVIIAIGICAVAYLDEIFDAIGSLGLFIISKTQQAMKNEEWTIHLTEVATKLYEQIAIRSLDSMFERIMVNFYILIISIIQMIPVVIAHIAAFSIFFELGIRRALSPLAVGGIVAEGFRGPGLRYFKKFFAVYMRIVVFYVIAVMTQKLCLIVWENSLTQIEVSLTEYEEEKNVVDEISDPATWMDIVADNIEKYGVSDGNGGVTHEYSAATVERIDKTSVMRQLNEKYKGNDCWDYIYKEYSGTAYGGSAGRAQDGKSNNDVVETIDSILNTINEDKQAANAQAIGKMMQDKIDSLYGNDPWNVVTLLFRKTAVVAALQICGALLILKSRGLADEVAGATR